MTVPRRKVAQRAREHPGALRWLLGARPQLDGKGSCSHGAIVRWRHLFVHQSTLAQWDVFQETYWEEMRNSIIMWHRQRGWRAPPSHLRGHEAERRWLAQERHDHPRGVYQIKAGTQWGIERTLAGER